MSGVKDDGATFDLPAVVTPDLLRRVMSRCPADRLEVFADALSSSCRERDITTPRVLGSYLGHLAWESSELQRWEEVADGSAYEGRLSLGNTEPGDGRRFKGRGPIQLTGRANHAACGLALGLDLVNHPELLLEPGPGCRSAAWFWWTRRLNLLAATDPRSRVITRRINGSAADGPPAYHLRRLVHINRALVAVGVTL